MKRRFRHLGVILISLALTTSCTTARNENVTNGLGHIRNIVAQLTLDEKISQVHGSTPEECNGGAGLPSIKRLGIPALCVSDGPAGIVGGTVFPAPVMLASTWNPELAAQYGSALATEFGHAGRNVVLGPTVNILRTPLWGRAAETFGEDPRLTSDMGAAVTKSIQKAGLIATVKHFAVNNQEKNRFGEGFYAFGESTDERVSERAMREIYFPAFKAAITEGHAGAVMCSYIRVGGEYACQSAELLRTVLRETWSFSGFVMSDWWGTHDTGSAVDGGLDVEMPGGDYLGQPLRDAVASGRIATSVLDEMVTHVLSAEFAAGLQTPSASSAGVVSPESRSVARTIISEGSVLLRNDRALLPLKKRNSMAVIGAAAADPTWTQAGSAAVPPSGEPITPLEALKNEFGSKFVSYSPGDTGTRALAPWTTDANLSNFRGEYRDRRGALVTTGVSSGIDVTGDPVPGLPAGWRARWNADFTAPVSGRYEFSLEGKGAASLSIGGKHIVSVDYADAMATGARGYTTLRAGERVPVVVDYDSASTVFGARIALGSSLPNPALVENAAEAARVADAALVFIGDRIGEGSDRPSAALSETQNELVSAVAKANSRTIVVLNTGAPVTMPWLDDVASVLQVWYPGEHYSPVLADMVSGDAAPSGHLPETFWADESQHPALDPRTYAGDGALNSYTEGLAVGYRAYPDFGRPLFPFGFGLTYTSFSFGEAHIAGSSSDQWSVHTSIFNVGDRKGEAVPQLYVRHPSAAKEPAAVLASFERVAIDEGSKADVTFHLAPADLRVWDERRGSWNLVSGRYQILLGWDAASAKPIGAVNIP
jgi:beta-glucosidase